MPPTFGLAEQPSPKAPRRTAFAAVALTSLSPLTDGLARDTIVDTIDKDPHATIAEVLRHRGESVIRSCEMTYSVIQTTPPPTDHLIQQEVAANRQVIQGLLSQATDEEEKSMLRLGLTRLEADVRRQMMAHSRLNHNVFYAMSGPSLGGDRCLEISERSGGRDSGSLDVIYRSLGPGGHLAIQHQRQRMTVLIRDRSAYYGTAEPHQLGRITGRLGSLATAAEALSEDPMEQLRGVSIKEVAHVQGHPAFQIDVTSGGSSETVTGTTSLTIVPAMGYVTPVIRDFSADGTLLEEWISDGYSPIDQQHGEPLWFPMDVTTRHFDRDGAETRALQYSFRPDSITLNGLVPADRFRLSLAPGMTIADTRVDPSATYSVRKETLLGLDEADSLAANDALGPVVVHPRTDAPAPMPGWRMPRGLVVNLAILAALAGLLWWRRKRATLAVLLLAVTLPGCGRMDGVGLAGGRSAGAATASDPNLAVTPATLDFGTISSSSDGRRLPIAIANTGSSRCRVSIAASCGCLVVTPTAIDLGPDETVTATAVLSPDGRPGLRRSQITVSATRTADSREAAATMVVPPIIATVTITTQWHATPRRLVMAPGVAGAEGTVTVSAPAADWEAVTVGTIGGDVAWEETSRSPGSEDGTEARSFRVAVATDGGGDRGLSFTLAGHASPLLVVPIILGR